MALKTRSLSPQESRVILALAERGRHEATRAEIVELLGASLKAADNVIESLRRKGWFERAAWGHYLVIPAEQGPEALGESNLLALAARIANPYYIGFGTAAAHYGLTTQRRHVIHFVTPARRRKRNLGDSRIQIVNQSANKFFGFAPVDVFGDKVMMSDREKTVIDCIDHPDLAGGVGETATILATASRRLDWVKAVDYLARIDSGALVRRFGWIADHVQADVPDDARARVRTLAAASRKTWLGSDPARKSIVEDAIGFDENWRIFINVNRRELRESAGLARRKTVRKGN